MNHPQDHQDLLLDLERSRQHEIASRRASDAMVACVRALAVSSEPTALFNALFAELKRALDADIMFVLAQVNAEPTALTVLASDRVDVVGQAWKRGEVLSRLGAQQPIACLFDVSLVEDWQGHDVGMPVVSALHIFIGSPERAAFLVCGSQQRGHFIDTHMTLAKALAPIAAQALARAEEYGRLQAKIARRIEIEEELRLSQAHMVHLQKMEAVGQLAAGLAHEINTPVQFVSDNLRFLATSVNGLVNLTSTLAGWLAPHMDQATLDQFLDAADFNYLQQEVPKAFQHCQDGINRVGHIVQTLKRFAETGSEEPTQVDLNAIIVSAIESSQNDYRSMATFTTDLSALPVVRCRAGEIRQVVSSLILNAIQAIEERGGQGSVVITTRLYGDQIELAISDDGCGMDEHVLRRACDPFFTTKPVGQGTGQGLSIAHEVVRRHGGDLTIDSRPGTGTLVTIRLPVAGEMMAEPMRA